MNFNVACEAEVLRGAVEAAFCAGCTSARTIVQEEAGLAREASSILIVALCARFYITDLAFSILQSVAHAARQTEPWGGAVLADCAVRIVVTVHTFPVDQNIADIANVARFGSAR